jgi:hypothetical protein
MLSSHLPTHVHHETAAGVVVAPPYVRPYLLRGGAFLALRFIQNMISTLNHPISQLYTSVQSSQVRKTEILGTSSHSCLHMLIDAFP